MLAIKLLSAIFIITFFIASSILLGLFVLRVKSVMKYLQKRKKSLKESDIDKAIIYIGLFIGAITLFSTFYFADESNSNQDIILFTVQITGFILAFIAAIIAFRNYLRKSGDKLSYTYVSTSTDISMLILRNEKDKTTSLFAIDIILKSGERIRLVNFFWPIVKPLNLSAFDTKTIDLGKVHLYGDRNPKEFNIKEISKLICITANGPSDADRFPTDSFTKKFRDKHGILLANRIRNIASKYKYKDIDPQAEYWLYFHEGETYRGESWSEKYILTGYLVDRVFFLTNQSLTDLEKPNMKSLKEYCLNCIHHKKIAKNYSTNKKDYQNSDGEYLVNGFFWDSDHERYLITDHKNHYQYYLFLDEIEKIVINNCYD